MGAFEYRQAEEIRDAFSRHGVRYLFIGKSGAVLLGFPDTTQVVELFVERSPENGDALAQALPELGFDLTPQQAREICAGKDFVQLKNGPFDLDLVFAPGPGVPAPAALVQGLLEGEVALDHPVSGLGILGNPSGFSQHPKAFYEGSAVK